MNSVTNLSQSVLNATEQGSHVVVIATYHPYCSAMRMTRRPAGLQQQSLNQKLGAGY